MYQCYKAYFIYVNILRQVSRFRRAVWLFCFVFTLLSKKWGTAITMSSTPLSYLGKTKFRLFLCVSGLLTWMLNAYYICTWTCEKTRGDPVRMMGLKPSIIKKKRKNPTGILSTILHSRYHFQTALCKKPTTMFDWHVKPRPLRQCGDTRPPCSVDKWHCRLL